MRAHAVHTCGVRMHMHACMRRHAQACTRAGTAGARNTAWRRHCRRQEHSIHPHRILTLDISRRSRVPTKDVPSADVTGHARTLFSAGVDGGWRCAGAGGSPAACIGGRPQAPAHTHAGSARIWHRAGRETREKLEAVEGRDVVGQDDRVPRKLLQLLHLRPACARHPASSRAACACTQPAGGGGGGAVQPCARQDARRRCRGSPPRWRSARLPLRSSPRPPPSARVRCTLRPHFSWAQFTQR